MEALGGIVMLFIGLLLLVLAVLWIALPFAVFGINGKLDKVIKELRRITGE